MPYRQSNWRTQVSVGPTGREINLGLTDRFSGGNKTSDTTSYERASGSVALGGRPSREDATATWLYDEAMHAIYKTIDAGVGVYKCVIIRTPEADDGTPYPGGALTFTGSVTGLSMPDTDYSSNDGAEVEITFNLDAPIA